MPKNDVKGNVNKIADQGDFSDFDDLDDIFDNEELDIGLNSVEKYAGVKYDEIEVRYDVVKSEIVEPELKVVDGKSPTVETSIAHVETEVEVENVANEIVSNVKVDVPKTTEAKPDVAENSKVLYVETNAAPAEMENVINDIISDVKIDDVKKAPKKTNVKTVSKKVVKRVSDVEPKKKRDRKSKSDMEQMRINQEIGSRLSSGESIESVVADKSLKLHTRTLPNTGVNIDVSDVLNKLDTLQSEDGVVDMNAINDMINSIINSKGSGMNIVNVKIDTFNFILGKK